MKTTARAHRHEIEEMIDADFRATGLHKEWAAKFYIQRSGRVVIRHDWKYQ